MVRHLTFVEQIDTKNNEVICNYIIGIYTRVTSELVTIRLINVEELLVTRLDFQKI